MSITVHAVADQPAGRITIADLRDFLAKWDEHATDAAEQAVIRFSSVSGQLVPALAGSATAWRIEADVP